MAETEPEAGRWRTPALAVVVFLFACWQFLGAVEDRPPHRDEARWIHRAEYVRELLTPFSDYWDEETWSARGGTMDERFRLRAQPPMGSYVMGIGFLLQGKPLPDIGFWNMDQDDAWNESQGNAPSYDQLMTGRRTSAVVGALTVTCIALVVNRLSNVAGGLIASGFLALHPLMTHLSTFAGSDAVLGFFIAAAAVAAYRWADRPTWPRALVIGLLLGLGASTKLSPLGITVPIALLGVLALVALRVPALEDERPSRSAAFQLIATPAVAIVTLVISYPWLWRDPISNTKALLDYRTLSMELQGSLWEHIAVDSRVDAFRRIGARLGSEWTVLDWGWLPEGFELMLAAAGLVLLAWRALREGLWSPVALSSVVLVGGAAVTVYGLDADWARYHLPILLLAGACIGVLAGEAARLFRPIAFAHDSLVFSGRRRAA